MAAWALGEREHPEAIPALGRAITDESPVVRRRVAWALGQIEDEAALAPLERAFRDRSPEVRQMAIWAVGEIESAKGVALLRGAVGDADWKTRQMVAWALGEIEHPSGVEVVAPLVKGCAMPGVRRMAAWAIGEIESGSGVAVLAPLVGDPELDVRFTALWALGEIEAHRTVDVVAPALKDRDPEVRRMAAWALGEIESSAAVASLTPLPAIPKTRFGRSRRGHSARSRASPPCRPWRRPATIGPRRSAARSDGPSATSTTAGEPDLTMHHVLHILATSVADVTGIGSHPSPAPPRPAPAWLVLLYQVPSRSSSVRVRIWRRLQGVGAVQIRQAAYVLPNRTGPARTSSGSRPRSSGCGGQATVLVADAIDAFDARRDRHGVSRGPGRRHRRAGKTRTAPARPRAGKGRPRLRRASRGAAASARGRLAGARRHHVLRHARHRRHGGTS